VTKGIKKTWKARKKDNMFGFSQFKAPSQSWLN